MMFWASIAASLLAAAGCGYLVVAAVLAGRHAPSPSPPALASAPGVTILKPLCGADQNLFDNLASFCTQTYPGPVQIIFGVQDTSDPAIGVVERLRKIHPERALDLVIDATLHGSNRKVSNLINMATRACHDIIVLADSDMRVDETYLARVIAALQAPGIGGVTCLYYEVAAGGFLAQLSALGVNAHFLPNVMVGLAFGRARPCFGSTIALRRATLAVIGGFAAVSECLADDYAIGAALRAKGHVVAVSSFAIAHVCRPLSAGELWRHELRWARTIKGIDPLGHAGSVVTHALPWGLIAAVAGLGSQAFAPALGLVVAAIGTRIVLLQRVASTFGLPQQTYWLLPLRDLLSAVVFLASFLGRGVSWNGRRYRVTAGGMLVPNWRSPKP